MKSNLNIALFFLFLSLSYASVTQAGPGGGDGPFPWNLPDPCWETQDHQFKMCFALDKNISEIRFLTSNDHEPSAVGYLQKEFPDGTLIGRLRDRDGHNWTLWIHTEANGDLSVHVGNGGEQRDLIMRLIK